MLHTTRPSSGFGKTLSEEELQEFNGVTYDKIKAMKSLPKLIRLEKYMREEGFPQTADMARKMVIELGGKDSCPHDWEPQFADVDAEFDAFLKNFDSWQATVKGADHNLRGLHQTKEDGQPGKGPQFISAKKSSNGNVIDNGVPRELPKRPQKDLRSGRAYYEQWDKYAAEAEKGIEEEEKARQAAANARPNPESIGDKKSDAKILKKEKKETLQQRLLSLAQTKSMTEREWFAEREREKGNDLFKAKEYTASLDAYSLAIELYSGSSLAFGNRAAANIKLKRWEEAHQDCCKALELDSNYVKALMRRGLASLEMDRPEDAMQDLEAALTLDPNSQETIALIRRTEPIVLKLQQKRTEELELEKKKAEEVERQKTTYVKCEPGTSKRATRMTIEDVEETSKVEKKDNSGAENSLFSNGHGKGEGDFMEKPKPKPVYNWPSKQKVNAKMSSPTPLKAQPKEHAAKKVDTGPAIDEKTSIDSSVNGRELNEVSKDEGEKLGSVVYHHPKVGTPVLEEVRSSDENQVNKVSNGQDSAQSGDVEHPQEILDAMEAQKSISDGHVAFGKPNVTYIGAQGNGNLKPFEIVNQVHTQKESKELKEGNNYVKLATNGNTKPAENAKQAQTEGILATEWRLTGNSFYAQGNIERAEASYTTSLKFDASSPSTLANRAMCRLKLKNFTGAVEDASNAISIDPKIHKAYYRRGLARRALAQLEAAKLDFEAVLALTPGDTSVITELESLEAEIREAQYIPMRVGPMTFEEVEDDLDVIVPCTPRPGSGLASGMATPRPAEFSSTPSTPRPGSTTGFPRSTRRPDEKNPNGKVYTNRSEELNGDDGVSQGSQVGGQSSQPGIQTSQGATQRTHSSSQDIQTPPGGSKSAEQCTEDHAPGFQVETRSSQSGAQSSQGSQSGFQGTQSPARDGVPACREAPVSLQEDADDSEQRAKEEKEKGNACFKKGQYTLAVECYTRSLELVPISAAVLSNRALSYIHLREYKKAVEDSSEAINIAPGYTKAFHRRATALHKLGKLQDALHDYQVVATFSPNDKKLKKDIEQLEKEIEIEEEKAEAKAKMTKPKSLPIRTTEPAGDGELLKPVKTTMLKPQQPQPTSKEYQATDENTVDTVVNTQVDGASSPRVRSDSVVELNNSMEVKAATKEVQKEIVVPRKPNTAFEFERVCNSLKGQPEVQREYVKSIEVEKYPVLFKELLSAGIMRCFIEALRRGFMPDDPQGALVVLRGLTKVKRFSMTLMLIAPSEKLTLETLLYWLEFSSDVLSTQVAELRVLYHIV